MRFRMLLCLCLLAGCRKVQDEPCFRAGTCGAEVGCLYNHQCSSGVCGGGACQAPTCGDAVKNGGETGIDCGGPCGATCALGIACASPADCAFGSCSAGNCAAPSSGPAPTGAVTATITPAGNSLEAVSAEHVAVRLAFPPGAVASSLTVKVTPLPLEGGGWIRLAIEPPGAAFRKPIAITVTLPPGAAGEDGTIRVGKTNSRFVLDTALDASTLTASANWFEVPSALPGLALQPPLPRGAPDLSLPIPADLLDALPLPLDLELSLAFTILDAAKRFGSIDDIMAFQVLVAKILQARKRKADTPRIAALLDQLFTETCTQFHGAQRDLDAQTEPRCSLEANPAQKRMLVWARSNEIVGHGVDRECSGIQDAGYLKTLAKSIGLNGVKSLTANKDAYAGCICVSAQRLGAGDSALINACLKRSLRPSALVPSADDVALPVSVVAAADVALFAEVEELADASRALHTDEEAPLLAAARASAYSRCREGGDSSPVGELLQRAPARPAIQQDAEYCSAQFAFTALDRAGNPGASGLLVVDAPGGATDATTSAALPVSGEGKIQLNGPLPALHCPAALDGSTQGGVEQDSVSIRVGGQEVMRQPADITGDLLRPTLTLAVADLYKAARQDPAVAPTLDLEVWRDSPGCSSLYLSSPFKLYTLHLTATVAVSLSIGGRNLGYPGDSPASPLMVVPGERAFVQVLLQHGDIPLPGLAVKVTKVSGTTSTPFVSLITDASGKASFTGDRPAENAQDTYLATYGENGADCSAVPRPAACHDAALLVYAASGVAVSGPTNTDKGSTGQFTAAVQAGADQTVTWTVSGLGSIDAKGLFTAGTKAGFFTVTATSTAHPWLGTAPSLVKFSNVDFLGHWTGTQTYDPATLVATDGGLIAGSTTATCTAAGATLDIVDCGIFDGGCGAVDPVDQLLMTYDPCNNFSHTGQSNGYGAVSDKVVGRADDLSFSVVDVDGGVIAIKGDFTVSGNGTFGSNYYLQRSFKMSKPW